MKRLLTLAGTLAVLAVLGKYYAVPLLAQGSAMPVLIENVDERGRIPYSQQSGVDCAASLCSVTFPPIATTKRLVVEHVNLHATTTPVIVGLLTTGGSFILPSQPAYPSLGPISQLTDSVVDSQLVAFVSGQSPVIQVARQSGAQATFTIAATITGYLVDLTIQ